MFRQEILRAARLLTGAVLLAASAVVAAESVTGAGASFPAPLYAKWAADYHRATAVQINYQSVGSGAGIKQIEAKTVDFGASDMPLTDQDLAAKGLTQFPTVLGGVVPVVNIVGLKPGELKLDGQTLADIYLGRITRWNDAAIRALNPGLALPDAPIAPVSRSDGSGTTFLFTNYLSKVSARWKNEVGEGTAVKWPVGVGGKGNEGVAAYVGRLPNAIGYVEYAYVKQNKMTYALLRNAAGAFVAPGGETFRAAAAGAAWDKTFYQVLTDQAGKDAWPISGATFILMHRTQDKPAEAAATLRFFDWAYREGAQTAAGLDYVTLPESVTAMIRQSWGEIKDTSGKAVAFR
ncbi:MAG: phosphate ABC transporter substrate-binding protein PstS [Azonexus sp.]|jgi:phosphate transport system substrate-binding protein|nr:phosphate ABC transporter substrate-binding protein PstS [Azonexus sp.]